MTKKRIKSLVQWFLTAIIFVAVTSRSSTKKAEPIYQNNLVEQRADPWVFKDKDGMYYFIATAPEYDRIEIRKSNTINGLTNAEAKVVWRKHETGVMGHHIWARVA